MTTTVGGVKIEIRGDNSPFNRSMREIEQRSGRTARSVVADFGKMDGAAGRLNATLRSTATSALALSAALGAGAGLASGIRTLADFGQAMSTVRAVTGATAEQFVLLEEKAKLLGATTRFSASQAAEGMLFLARAGFSVDAVLGSIEGTLQLAQAGAMDLGRAADIASNILTAFRLETDQTSRVVDVLAKASNMANTSVEQLGEGMKYVAPVAAGFGISIEETTALVAALSDAGIQSSMAGTSVRNVLGRLATNTDKIAKELGLSVEDLNVQTLGITQVLENMAAAGIDTTKSFELFEQRGGPALDVMVQALPKIRATTDALNAAGGTADTVSKIMDDNLNGAILGALSAFEALILALGKAGADSALTTSFKGLADLLRFAARNSDVLGVAVVALASRALIPLAAKAIPAAIVALRTFAGTLIYTQGVAARAMVVMNAFGGPLTLAIAGAAAAFIALSRANVTTDEALQDLNSTLGKSKELMDTIAKDTEALEKAQARLTQAIKDGGDAAEAAARKEVGAISERLRANRDLMAAYERQARASLRAAEQGSKVERGQLARGIFGNIEGNDFNQANRDPDQFERRIRGTIDGFNREYDAAVKSGQALTDKQRRIQSLILDYETARAEIEKARAAVEAFGEAASAEIGGPAGLLGDEVAVIQTEIDPTDYAAIRAELERAFEIELAQAANDEERLRFLEDQEEVLRRTADYVAANLTVTQAEAIARAEVLALRSAEADAAERAAAADDEAARALAAYEEFYLRREQARRDRKAQDDLEEAAQRRIADAISRGLEDGIRSGNWGDAFRDILARSTTDALSQAINDLAAEILSLFKGAFSGGGLGGGIASIFGGGRAAGGSVQAGMRYMVGESGPEMFVPRVPGVVVPKFEGPASAAAAGGLGGPHVIHVAPQWHVHGSITEEVLPRVQAMMAEQAKALPRVVHTVIRDGQRRGRY